MLKSLVLEIATELSVLDDKNMSIFNSPERVYVIGEIGQAHDGSLGIAHSYIDSLAAAGVSAVKFQMHIADAESSDKEVFRIPFSYEDNSRYDYWKRMEFTAEQWAGLRDHCHEKKLDFLVSPFSVRAFNLLEQLGVTQYKIASGEVANYLLIDKIIATQKPILLSSGISPIEETEKIIARIRATHEDIVLFQCTTQYPTLPGQYGLSMIQEYQRRFNLRVGLSDHSGKTSPSIAAVALGATALEVHVVFDREMFGPDARSSLLPSEIKVLVEESRAIAHDLQVSESEKMLPSNSEQLRKMFGKTLTAARDIPLGKGIEIDDLESSKPAECGIPASSYRDVIGRCLKRSTKAREFIRQEDLV